MLYAGFISSIYIYACKKRGGFLFIKMYPKSGLSAITQRRGLRTSRPNRIQIELTSAYALVRRILRRPSKNRRSFP